MADACNHRKGDFIDGRGSSIYIIKSINCIRNSARRESTQPSLGALALVGAEKLDDRE